MATGPAFLLLLLVTAGLFAMHTLGHGAEHASPMPAHAMTVAPPRADLDMVAAGHGDSSQATDRTPSQPLPFGSLAVCMAVLCTFAMLVLGVHLSRRLPSLTVQINQLIRPVTDMVRGPPGIPIGLLVADLSVARN